MRSLPRLLLLVPLLAVTAGCFSFYRVDIQQGNVVTPEMAASLKAGMTHRQVSFALGSPLVTDPFHADRWDYYYSLRSDTSGSTRHRLTLWFRGDSLVRADGDLAPAGLKSAIANGG